MQSQVKQIKTMWYKIINEKLKEKGVSVLKMSQDCDIPYSTLHGNLKGESDFSGKNLTKILSYLEIKL